MADKRQRCAGAVTSDRNGWNANDTLESLKETVCVWNVKVPEEVMLRKRNQIAESATEIPQELIVLIHEQ
ncbi:hypothetical protein J6590_088179 [Homalodisca vitripennis]|nr:hypothetical protein J6590_088179 [Homalodisca vitripennis]